MGIGRPVAAICSVLNNKKCKVINTNAMQVLINSIGAGEVALSEETVNISAERKEPPLKAALSFRRIC